jgi:hypothetical protein
MSDRDPLHQSGKIAAFTKTFPVSYVALKMEWLELPPSSRELQY